MTPKAEYLLLELESCYSDAEDGLDARQQLVAYIEELERKAQAYDNLDATAEAMCRMSLDQLRGKLVELQRAAGIPTSDSEIERDEWEKRSGVRQ